MVKKMSAGMNIVLGVITLVSIGVFVLGCIKIKNFTAGKRAWLKKLGDLPVLHSDSDIAEALKGAPKDYLVEDYTFTRGMTVQDRAFDCLKGEYLYIKITQETYTVNDAYIQRYRNAVWTPEPYADIEGKLFFENGTPLEIPAGTRFEFSLADDSKLKQTDIKPDKQANYFMARYYPDGVREINTKKMRENFEKNLGKNTKQYSSRYKYNFMQKGDKATFVARIGYGTATLIPLEEQSVIAVKGNRKALAKYLNSKEDRFIMDYVKLGFWILGMWLGFCIGSMAGAVLISSIATKPNL